MYILKHFTLDELFHPSFFDSGADPINLLPERIYINLDKLREDWDRPIIINSKIQHYCGVRPLDSKIGAKKSSHKLLYDRHAFDLHGRNANETHALYEWCCVHGPEYNIVRMEDFVYTAGWCHIEISIHHTGNPVYIFKP